jgi:cellulose synthase/poly-beta-1,6-N-acetylglucosamine synthase-like glycosyltransferase
VVWPRISVVTPSLNQGQFLEQTILSVIGQEYPNLEYCVFDGGSTDNSVEVIRQYGSRITAWRSEADGGGFGYSEYRKSRDYGVSVSSTEWVSRQILEAGFEPVLFQENGWDDCQNVWAAT